MASWKSRGWSFALATGIGAAVALGGAALAHDDKLPANASAATKTAYARHANFEKLGASFKGLNDELRKSSPDKAVVAANAKTMSTLVNALPTWFPRGSGVEARPMSEAKPTIWTDAAGFTAAATASRTEVAKLNASAAAGDLDAVKAQVRPVGGTCKGCHDKFRQEKKG